MWKIPQKTARRLAHPASDRSPSRLARSLRLFAIALLAGSLGGCPSTPDDPEGTATIGPAGGTVTGPGGARLVVPAGALSSEVEITLEHAAAPGTAPFPATGVGETFRLLPHGLGFAVPATLYVPVPAGGSELTLYALADDADTDWEVVRGGTIDDAGGRVEIAHLSYYRLGSCSMEGDCWTCDPAAPRCGGSAPDGGSPADAGAFDAGPFDAGPPACAEECVAPTECLWVPDYWACLQPCDSDADCPVFEPECRGNEVSIGGHWCEHGACTGIIGYMDCAPGTCAGGECVEEEDPSCPATGRVDFGCSGTDPCVFMPTEIGQTVCLPAASRVRYSLTTEARILRASFGSCIDESPGTFGTFSTTATCGPGNFMIDFEYSWVEWMGSGPQSLSGSVSWTPL